VDRFKIQCVIFILCFPDLFAGPGYLISLSNCEKISQDTYEFDVIIKSTGIEFQITSYQCAFSFNSYMLNGGSATFNYIPESSEFESIPPSVDIKLDSIDNIHEVTFASMPGIETISTIEKKIGRFRLTNSIPFACMDPNFKWDFEGVLNTIMTGQNFTVITNSDFHLYDFLEINKLQVLSAAASGTTDLNTAPEKTIDGLGYYDNDPNARWAASPFPQGLCLTLDRKN
jgi:hypothetical protein